jgi:hypothetical protein
MQFGSASVYLGAGRWWQGSFQDWKKLDVAKRRALRAAVMAYEVDPDALDQERLWRWSPYVDAIKYAKADEFTRRYPTLEQVGDIPNSHLTAILSIRSFIRYSYDIRRRFGTRVFLASTAGDRHDRIIDGALELANRKGWDAPLEQP